MGGWSSQIRSFLHDIRIVPIEILQSMIAPPNETAGDPSPIGNQHTAGPGFGVSVVSHPINSSVRMRTFAGRPIPPWRFGKETGLAPILAPAEVHHQIGGKKLARLIER